MPYSQQFKFVFLATNPFMPRWLACWLINSWMTSLYKRCGIVFMGPAQGSAFNFTGQCNDAFFQLALQVCVAIVYLPFVLWPCSQLCFELGCQPSEVFDAVQGKVTYLVDRIKSAHGRKLTLESGAVLPAHILVNARERPLHVLYALRYASAICVKCVLHWSPMKYTVCVLRRGL